MGAIPLRPVGKFVFVGDNQKADYTSKSSIDFTVKALLQDLYDGMFIYQQPTRHPTPGIPMAAKDYPVTITPMSVLKHRQRAALQRQKRRLGVKTKKPARKKTKTKFKVGLLSKWRTRYHMFKGQWMKSKRHWNVMRINRDKQRELREKRKAFNARFAKFKDTRLGKLLRIGKGKKRRGKTFKFGILDRIAPIQRGRTTKKRDTSKTITVKPGRLRRASARGLRWEGSTFAGGMIIRWGVPLIGGGRFYNYASEVEMKNRPALKGRGAAPYVKRTMIYLAEECRLMAMQVNGAFGEYVGSPRGIYGTHQVIRFESYW